MHSKKYLVIFTISFIIIYGLIKIPSISRAASDSNQIPSDLSLDLDLAQKDPAPAQKQIIQSQTSQAKIVTDKGEQAVIEVKDEVPAEVKLQPAKDALNPEQTTSEQVINKNVETDQDQSVPVTSGSPSDSNDNNPASTPAGNVIPGTDIVEPDDNTAPLPSSFVNPSANPSEAPQGPSVSSGPAQNENPTNSSQPTNSPVQPETPQPENTTNTIPPENGVAPVPAAPQQEQSQPSSNSESTPSQPSSGNNDSGGSNSGGSESSSGDNSAVQGVSTVSWWRIFVNQMSKIFKQ